MSNEDRTAGLPAASRWTSTDAPRGADYDHKWKQMAAAGQDPHGEVSFVERYNPNTILDAGCGTGRVAIELTNRGYDVVGFDLDEPMLSAARQKEPAIPWHLGDAATIELEALFDVVVMAGNVMIFVEPGTEAAVVANMSNHVRPGGRLIAGFSLRRGRYDLAQFDHDAKLAGLTLEERFSTWNADEFAAGGDYAVSVFVKPSGNQG